MTLANLGEVKKALNSPHIPRGVLPYQVDNLMGIEVEYNELTNAQNMPSLKKKMIDFGPHDSSLLNNSECFGFNQSASVSSRNQIGSVYQ